MSKGKRRNPAAKALESDLFAPHVIRSNRRRLIQDALDEADEQELEEFLSERTDK